MRSKQREIDALDQDTTLVQLRSHIDNIRAESYAKLNQLLPDEFNTLGIQFEQATWDDARNKEGKPIKRPLTLADIEALTPFHWGYEFDQIINERGGFDAIITNPPWETLKPNAKEFFEEHSELVIQRKMDIKEFEKEQTKLLKDPVVAKAWLIYQSNFPHLSTYFRSARQYRNQISTVNGRKTGSDVNLYKLFLEQTANLLRANGRCGIIVPTSVYTDLGATQLRHVLFFESRIETLFGLSNERFIFEGVDHRFKVCLLTFEKGGSTDSFEAAFRMHPHEAVKPDELDIFLHNFGEHLRISVALIRRLSPASLSVMEFRNNKDIVIAEKMIRFPLLGESIAGSWNLRFTAEFHMTNDSKLFAATAGGGRLPLYEGKMMWQFDHKFASPRYWVDESKGRKALPRQSADKGQLLDYQLHRLGFRAVASNTNERTLIATILPKEVFCGNSLLTSAGSELDGKTLLFVVGIFNSFVVDTMLRSKATINVNMFYVYQLPIPRLTEKDPEFAPIVARAAKLICTTPEFDDLAREVGLGSHKNGVTAAAARAQLRAELDSLVAHLYGLTEEEFAYVLTTFPLVDQPVKDAALAAFRAFAPKPGDPEIAALLMAGENAKVEFKSSARWDLRENKKNPVMEQVILKTVAAFLNSDGGTLLLGVSDDGTVLGLEHDYQTLQKKNADGYELFLSNLLLTHYGKDLSRNLKFSSHEVDGKQVCKIGVEPSPRAVWVKEGADEHLYVRAGNSTRRLTTKEAIDYSKTRFAS